MSMFEPITLTHKGEQKTLPANQVLRLIAIIEQHFNPYEVQRCAIPPGATVALFYVPILVFFGFKDVDPEALAMEFTRDYEKGMEVVKFCVDLLKKLDPPQEIIDITDPIEPPLEPDGGEKKPETAAP